MAMIHRDVYEKPQFKRQPRTIVALDIKKAFDSIPHKTVIEAAQRRGIRGNMLNFIKSFLKERTYQIVIGENRSPWRHNNTGVPQGAVISPTLFNMAMTDLANALDAIPNINFSIYADDVTLWTVKGIARKQKETMQKALDVTQAFARQSGLHLSPEKTSFMIVPKPHVSTNIFNLKSMEPPS